MSTFQFTRQTDYGISILTSLAKKGQGQIVNLTQLSADRYLPRAFASQIGKKLVKAKMIGSKEGRGGGYYLLKDPSKLNLLEIIRVIEGKFKPVWCTHMAGQCPAESICLQRPFMLRLAGEMENLLERYTLADIIA
jgi:Rrf2 family protein